MKVKLIKGLSYKQGILLATVKNPYIDCSEEDAQKLIETGYFEFCEQVAESNTNVSNGQTADDKELQKMTKDELVAYATECNIDISNCSKKDEIFNAIIESVNSPFGEE